MTKVYLDYAATTPVSNAVYSAMEPYFIFEFGNPSSIHQFGQTAEDAVEMSRELIARHLNANLREIVFTSSGTESNNLALRGTAIAEMHKRGAAHILISPVEHHAVSRTAIQLAELYGFNVEYLDVDRYGIVSPDSVKRKIRSDTAVVSVIYANNEIGSINPIAEIGAVCHEHGVPFHTDTMQAGAFLSLDTKNLGVDLLTIGGHKLYGPKGIGALFISHRVDIVPILTGGSQERGLRAGTHNVPLIVGLAHAINHAQLNRETFSREMVSLRDFLIEQTLLEIPGCILTGHPQNRLPNHASFAFEGIDGNELIMMLDIEGFACSSGSACKTGLPEPSEVLLAMGIDKAYARGSLRVTLGHGNTAEDIEIFATKLQTVISRIRGIKI